MTCGHCSSRTVMVCEVVACDHIITRRELNSTQFWQQSFGSCVFNVLYHTLPRSSASVAVSHPLHSSRHSTTVTRHACFTAAVLVGQPGLNHWSSTPPEETAVGGVQLLHRTLKPSFIESRVGRAAMASLPVAQHSGSAPFPPAVTARAHDFPMDGLSPVYLRQLIVDNGGEAAFEGISTSIVKRNIILPKTQTTQLSLCAQMRLEGDARVQAATWFVSHPWQIMFLDLVRALEAFFADKPGAVIWLDLISTSQHATLDRPPEWWQQTFCSAIGRMGQMVMVMTPWDNPICLTRAWCLIELYACRSSGSHFGVALPPSERERFLSEIVHRGGAFYNMLSRVSTAKSECSRDSDKQRIFAAVEKLDGGFAGLDRGVLQTMTEWLERQLEDELSGAVAAGREDIECMMMSALGGLFDDKGAYDQALSLHEKCLEKRRRFLGDNHPDTLTSCNSVARLFQLKGEYNRALPMYEDCFAKRKCVLGDDHLDTLASLNNVANLLIKLGDYDRSLPMLEECLARKKRILGDDHLDTVGSLNNIANLLEFRGEYDRALPLYEECVEKRRRVLGDGHPDTLKSLDNLAGIFYSKGEYDRSLHLLEENLVKWRRVLGDGHPDALHSLHNLANSFESKGDSDRALLLLEECLAKLMHIFGDEHPDTLMSLGNLAAFFARQGQLDRALLLQEECLTKKKRILGDAHPIVLTSLYNLAAILYDKGEYDRALPLYEECVEKRRRVLGDGHPDTLKSLDNLAGIFYSKGEYDRALSLYEESLMKRRRALGDDHLHTLISLDYLAGCFFCKGEYSRALPLYEECLVKRRRMLGDRHPDTAHSQQWFDACARQQQQQPVSPGILSSITRFFMSMLPK